MGEGPSPGSMPTLHPGVACLWEGPGLTWEGLPFFLLSASWENHLTWLTCLPPARCVATTPIRSPVASS